MNYQFPPDFFFGVSNAANQVEDNLEDNWLRFSQQNKLRCFEDSPAKYDRIRFWSEPQVELDLAQDLGVQVFRLSLAWERLVPQKGEWNEEAAQRYLEILRGIKSRGMKVMLTLFHHSIPTWMEDEGGWVHPASVDDFKFFSKKSLEHFGELVDFWITVNEPVPWSYLTYHEGLFPPGKKGSLFSHFKALKHMAQSHNEFFTRVRNIQGAPVGIAHHMGLHQGRGFFNHWFSKLSDYLAHWQFLDRIEHHMDFFGINYYGAEWMTPAGPAQYADLDYSDAGRAICPIGLYRLLHRIHQKFPKLPIIITENGVGDGTDQVRPAYLMEHLIAVIHAIKDKIPVIGYVHWTLSDNLEWSDGYGPKFGLIEVERKNNLKRLPRKSFSLYQKIIHQRGFTHKTRDEAWATYESNQGKPRPYWRSADGKHGLDTPTMRLTPQFQDWRFPTT
jgi:beta-glucosidase/6-phospho-beta-glucosidase/beta-galactosidase